MNKTPTTLIIMDGFGIAAPAAGNAVTLAKTPVLDRLFQEYAHTTLSASGLDVGLPAGQMGNSEVGHTNIGGGRVVFQDLPASAAPSRTAASLRTRPITRRWTTAWRRAPACTCAVCCPTAASTPTSSTCSPCCKWLRTRG